MGARIQGNCRSAICPTCEQGVWDHGRSHQRNHMILNQITASGQSSDILTVDSPVGSHMPAIVATIAVTREPNASTLVALIDTDSANNHRPNGQPLPHTFDFADIWHVSSSEFQDQFQCRSRRQFCPVRLAGEITGFTHNVIFV